MDSEDLCGWLGTQRNSLLSGPGIQTIPHFEVLCWEKMTRVLCEIHWNQKQIKCASIDVFEPKKQSRNSKVNHEKYPFTCHSFSHKGPHLPPGNMRHSIWCINNYRFTTEINDPQRKIQDSLAGTSVFVIAFMKNGIIGGKTQPAEFMTTSNWRTTC